MPFLDLIIVFHIIRKSNIIFYTPGKSSPFHGTLTFFSFGLVMTSPPFPSPASSSLLLNPGVTGLPCNSLEYGLISPSVSSSDFGLLSKYGLLSRYGLGGTFNGLTNPAPPPKLPLLTLPTTFTSFAVRIGGDQASLFFSEKEGDMSKLTVLPLTSE